MIFRGVNLLRSAIELGGFDAVVVAPGAGFLVILWILNGARIGVFFKEFSLFQRVPGAMQQAYLFRTGQCITRMACIVSLAISSGDLLGVG